jgi:hypothetical protein
MIRPPPPQRFKNGTSLFALAHDGKRQTFLVVPKPQPLATVRLIKDGRFVTPRIPVIVPSRKP